MGFLVTLSSTAIFAVLGFSAVMIAAYHGLAPCPTCRDLLTPYQGGLIYLQITGVVVGAALGRVVAWLINRSRAKRSLRF